MKKQSNARFTGKKILVNLTAELEADIASYCREKGIGNRSELLRQALIKYIERDADDATLELQAVKKNHDRLAELRDMTDVLFRYVRLMHINLLAYHPEIDGGFSEAAFQSANARHAKFFDAFQDSLRSDPPFFERLLHTYFSGSIK